jgi:hypothetical protein
VKTGRTFPNNIRDINTRDNERATCLLIDITIPGDRNVFKKETEKILNCKEIECIGNVKRNVVLIIWATVTM